VYPLGIIGPTSIPFFETPPLNSKGEIKMLGKVPSNYTKNFRAGVLCVG